MASPLPPELEQLAAGMAHLWAKSPKEREQTGYPLFHHTLDVCFQSAQFFNRDLSSFYIKTDIDLRRILAYAALIHDFGKIHPMFQQALQRGGARFDNRHEVLSLAFLRWLVVPEVELPWLQCSIAFHHRGFSKLFARGARFSNPSESDYACELSKIHGKDARLLWEVLRSAPEIFLHTGWGDVENYSLLDFSSDEWLQNLDRPIRQIQSFVKQFAASGSDQLRSVESLTMAIRVRGLLINADHLASFGKRELSSAIVSRQDARRQFAVGWEPVSHQRDLLNTVGSARLIAPTGSGKTEAALFWAASQFESGEAKGRICFVLPYQASMNAMQRRLLDRLCPDSKLDEARAAIVAVVHGRSARNIYERLLEQKYTPKEAGQIARNAEPLGRLHAAPIAIFSAYAIIRTLFSHTPEPLMQSYAGARFILDEIHAYEVDVTALTLAALRSLCQRMNARVLFMTATLPRHLNGALLNSFGNLAEISAGEDVTNRPPRHWVKLLPFHSLSESATELIRRYARNGSILVVVNQIKRARSLAATLRGAGLDVLLLHSRFTQEDRARKEAQLRPLTGRILVATQVVEVSLDVSFAYCFSELAPAESLLQRFGRCNRRGKCTPAAPNCFVFLEFPKTQHGYKPYEEEHLNHFRVALTSTLDDKKIVEKDLQPFLDSSYPNEMQERLSSRLKRSIQQVEDAIVSRFEPFGMQDSSALTELDRQWQQLFDGQEVLPSSLVEKARAEETWFGRAKYLVPVSSHVYRKLKPRFDEDLNCDIVETPYDPELGLEG